MAQDMKSMVEQVTSGWRSVVSRCDLFSSPTSKVVESYEAGVSSLGKMVTRVGDDTSAWFRTQCMTYRAWRNDNLQRSLGEKS